MRPFRKRHGFTLVEIVVTIGILVIFTAMAVPHFIRTRKRSQAVRILQELRHIEGAKDQWATENHVEPFNAVPEWPSLRRYVDPASSLRRQQGPVINDLLGNPYTIGALDTPPSISEATYSNFEPEINGEFWGSYWRSGEFLPSNL